MFDIITFGSATSDTFLKLKEKSPYLAGGGGNSDFAEKICFPLGAKVVVENLKSASGGGGTNTACSFAGFGFKAVYMGKIGDDAAGAAVVHDLEKFSEKSFRLSNLLLQKDKSRPTASSFIVSTAGGERTALVCRGACHFLKKEEIPWRKVKRTKWFYLAPLSGQSADLFFPLLEFAGRHNIKVAANLGDSQLKLERRALLGALKKLDILFLNLEEAVVLCGYNVSDEAALLGELASFGSRIVAVTKGSEGSVVAQGGSFWQAGINKVKVVEKTGAGDAYSSGFTAGLLMKDDIEYAIQLAAANAASCIEQVGAKNGLLKRADLKNLPQVKIARKTL